MKLWNCKKVLGLLLCSLVCTMTAPLLQAAQKKAYLFVHSAVAATFSTNQDKQHHTLVLHQVNPYLTYFSERPERESGSLKIEKFLGLWKKKNKNSFSKDAPNAVVQGSLKTAGNTLVNYAVELIHPKYDATTKTLTYTIKPLAGATTPLPNAIELQQVTLFIDDVCLSCF
jgi:hypothetical protein